MIQQHFEAFTLLKTTPADDGLGAQPPSLTEDVAFRGALTCTTGKELTTGGRAVLEDKPTLLYDPDVTLAHGDRVRREKDGSIYRVCADSMRAPAWSGLRFAQTTVERLVIPC